MSEQESKPTKPQEQPKLGDPKVQLVPRPAISLKVPNCRGCPFAEVGQVVGGAGQVLLCSLLRQSGVSHTPLPPPCVGRIKQCPLVTLGPVLVQAVKPTPEQQISQLIKP